MEIIMKSKTRWVVSTLIVVGMILQGCGGGGSGAGGSVEQPISRDIVVDTVISESADTMGGSSLVETLEIDSVEVSIPSGSLSDAVDMQLIIAELESAPAELIGTTAVYLLSDIKPFVNGDYSLRLPLSMAPTGIEPSDLQVYNLRNGRFLDPVDAQIDLNAGYAIVDNPDVSVLRPSANPLRGFTAESTDKSKFKVAARMNVDIASPAESAYVIGSRGSEQTTCVIGESGEVHKEPGHYFTINIAQSTSCEFVRFVSSALQDALDTYNTNYLRDDGTMPFSSFSANNRMAVYLGDYDGVNGDYKTLSWKGYINVDVATGESNQLVLRDTLFHEMFHALQDAYISMYFAGRDSTSMWWLEATAQWAGLDATSKTLESSAGGELSRYNYFLSVPMQESRSYGGGLVSYAFSTMVFPAEELNPGYVGSTLKSTNLVFSTSKLYNDFVSAAQLDTNYGDWLTRVLQSLTSPSAVWSSARIFSTPTVTRTMLPDSALIGAAEDTLNRQEEVDRQARFRNRSFSIPLGPLTSRFVSLQYNGDFITPHSANIAASVAGTEHSDLLVMVKDKTTGAWSTMETNLPSTRIGGIGENISELLIAVYNSSTSETLNVKVDIEQSDSIWNWTSTVVCPDVFDPNYGARWTVDLEETEVGVSGNIHFHACPGGGRLSYSVTGDLPKPGETMVLDGTKSTGRGGLFASGPETATFTLDRYGAPNPAFAR